MKVQINKQDLLSLMSRVQNIVEKRNLMPILVNILMVAENNKLKAFVTNLEVSLTDEINAQVLSAGQVAANAKSLFDIIKELPDGMVELEGQENNWLKIHQNKSVFNIVGINPDEYPVFPTLSAKEFTPVDRKMLSEMIEKTIYSVSNDETRYHLNGVYFENQESEDDLVYRMVATDGHRLSLVDRSIKQKIGWSGSKGVIIPRKGLYEIRKLLESSVEETFKMAIEGSQIIIKSGDTILMIRLIEGKYPQYQRLIPQNLKEQVRIDRESLLSCLKRVSLLSNQKSKGVTLQFSAGKVQISSNNPDLGDAKEEIEIDYTGKDMKIGFNARYVLDVLSSIEDKNVDINLNDQLSPGLLRPENDKNYTCVIMPMRMRT